MKHTIALILAAILAATVLPGCVSSRSGRVYSRDQAQVVQNVEWGTIRHVEPVKIEGTKSGVGTVAGGVAGGVAGSTIGQGTGRTLATLGGAIVGAIAGSLAEEGITGKSGLELTVQKDDGKNIVVVQEADQQFIVGDRVRIVKAPDGTTRIRH